jgi:hypothetical protein
MRGRLAGLRVQNGVESDPVIGQEIRGLGEVARGVGSRVSVGGTDLADPQ